MYEGQGQEIQGMIDYSGNQMHPAISSPWSQLLSESLTTQGSLSSLGQHALGGIKPVAEITTTNIIGTVSQNYMRVKVLERVLGDSGCGFSAIVAMKMMAGMSKGKSRLSVDQFIDRLMDDEEEDDFVKPDLRYRIQD